MRYAAFKGPRSQHVEKLWMIGSCLEVPEVLGAFVLVALTSIVFASTKKTAGNGVPMSCMAVAGLWLLTIQRQTAPIPTSQPRCYVLHIFFSCWDWCTSWLEGGMGKLSICFFYFGKKNPKISGGFPVGVSGFIGFPLHVRWMVLLLWSFHQACWPQPHDAVVFCCYAMVVDPSGPWGHNQVLGEEILERFAAVVSWPSKKEKDHFENVPRMFVWMFRIINSNLLNHICCICQVIARFMEIFELYLPCHLVGSFC